MKVPFTDLKLLHDTFESKLVKEIKTSISQSLFILGSQVKKFEKDYAY